MFTSRLRVVLTLDIIFCFAFRPRATHSVSATSTSRPHQCPPAPHFWTLRLTSHIWVSIRSWTTPSLYAEPPFTGTGVHVLRPLSRPSGRSGLHPVGVSAARPVPSGPVRTVWGGTRGGRPGPETGGRNGRDHSGPATGGTVTHGKGEVEAQTGRGPSPFPGERCSTLGPSRTESDTDVSSH